MNISKLNSMILKGESKITLLLRILILYAIIPLLIRSDGSKETVIILAFGIILLMVTKSTKDYLKYILLSFSVILLCFIASYIQMDFMILLNSLYPLLLIYAFLLPNPVFTLVISTIFALLLFTNYKDTVDFVFIQNNIIGFFVNSIIYSLLIFLMKQLKEQNGKLQRSDEDTQALLSLLPEPVVVHTKEEILYINNEGINLVGANDSSGVLGQSPLDFIQGQYHEFANHLMDTFINKNDITRNNEFKLRRNNGEIIDIECSSVSFTYRNTPSLITIVNDITTKKKEAAELIQKSDKLKLVGQLAAGIAHEIRNPLTSIKGFLQIIQEQDNQNQEFIEIMLSELERINFIVNEFLVLSKPQSVEFKKKNVLPVLDNVVKLLNTEVSINNVEIHTEYDSSIPLVFCEENQLKQVFINIIKNAIESMPSGGVLQVQAKVANNQVMVSFRDKGVGITKERLKTLGEPFYTTKEKGTGLGLMVCFKIIENHNGQIKFKSELSSGTTVDIILPIEKKSSLVERHLDTDSSVG